MRFYGMLSIADTVEEINKLSQINSIGYNTGTKNICLCKENGKFYESSGGNFFECSEINSALKVEQSTKPNLPEQKPLPSTNADSNKQTVILDGQEMDLQTFANETFDTLKQLNDFKTRFENIFNGGNK